MINPYEVVLIVFSLLFPRYNENHIRPATDRIANIQKKKLTAPSDNNGLKASLDKLNSSNTVKNH